jgi:hypothetical protein
MYPITDATSSDFVCCIMQLSEAPDRTVSIDSIARPWQSSAFHAIAAKHHGDVLESRRDIIKFESRQN